MILLTFGFGLLVVVAGALFVVNPQLILDYIRRYKEAKSLFILAVVARLSLGGVLLAVADKSSLPLAVTLLGGLAVFAGLSVLLMGQQRFTELMEWALRMPTVLARVAGLIAVALGGLIIYAFWGAL